MALGGTNQSAPQLAPINPANLIGRADPNIVEPRATAILTDAFRQGVVTADDIMSRIGEGAQAKKKAELQMANAASMQATEAQSAEAQAARAQQLATKTAVDQTAQAKAERDRVLTQYPAVAYFDKFAGDEGLKAPTLPDGSPDYKEMEEIGSELAVYKAKQTKALTEFQNIESVTRGGITYSQTKQGKRVTPERVQELTAIIQTPFIRDQTPGTVVSSATSDAVAAPPVVEARGSAPAAASAESMVAPRGTLPFGTIIPGVGFSTGESQAQKGVDPTERAQAIATSEALLPQIADARAAVARGKGVGPMEGALPVKWLNQLGAAFGAREAEFNDQRQLNILISQKILEGSKDMKGNLSDKDVRFLTNTVPKLSDSEATWNTFLNRWEAMTKTNLDILSGRIPKPAGDLFAPAEGTAASASASASTAPVKVNSPAEAPPTAQFIQAPDGRVFKNPNYRP